MIQKVFMKDCCVYCGSEEGLEWHHIMPKSLGGTDDLYNLVRVCNVHHSILHSMTSRTSISELTKIGLDKAKERGVVLGGPLKITPSDLAEICELRSSQTLDQLSDIFGYDRSTIARVVKKWSDKLEEYSKLYSAQQKQ